MGVERLVPLAQRYRLLAPVGSGGMGTVWHAYDEMLDRDVAIKEVRLPERLTEGERRLLCRRLIDEARATAALRHPGVVAVHDVLIEDGRPWIVMEYLDARSLHRVLAEEGPLTPARTAEIGSTVLSVLRAAHTAGILHRDVKPSNVLLCSDGRTLLTDFGLSLHTHRGQENADTLVAGIEGSPAYLPPERIQGEPSTPASDLWSLGATLYTSVEGTPPFLRPHALASMLAVLLGEYPKPRRAGPLTPVITALLDEDPAARPHPAALAATLEAITTPAPVEPSRPALWRRRLPRLAGVTALVSMVIVLGAWSARWNSVGQSDALSLLPGQGATPKSVSYRGPGFTIDVPASWKRTQHEATVTWNDPNSAQELRIAPASGDALTGLKAAERRASGVLPGYRRLRLEPAPELATGAAEWEYAWKGTHGLRSRAAGFEFAFHAPEARWTPGQRLYDRMLKTFRSERS